MQRISLRRCKAGCLSLLRHGQRKLQIQVPLLKLINRFFDLFRSRFFSEGAEILRCLIQLRRMVLIVFEHIIQECNHFVLLGSLLRMVITGAAVRILMGVAILRVMRVAVLFPMFMRMVVVILMAVRMGMWV